MGNFLFQDRDSGILEQVGRDILDGSGHLSYLPGKEWILNDTYLQGKERVQIHTFSMSLPSGESTLEFHYPRFIRKNGGSIHIQIQSE